MIRTCTHYQITDPDLLRKWLKRLKIRPSLSPDIHLTAHCSLCGQNYGLCNHIPGQSYENVQAKVIIDDLEITAISAVDTPRQDGCNLDSIYIPSEWCHPQSETAIKSIPICDVKHSGQVLFGGFCFVGNGLDDALDKLFGKGCWQYNKNFDS